MSVSHFIYVRYDEGDDAKYYDDLKQAASEQAEVSTTKIFASVLLSGILIVYCYS